jgi:hypothetical protein
VYTRTNLQSAGAILGRRRQRAATDRAWFWTQDAGRGAEPLLFGLADPAAENGAYYGPRGWTRGPTRRVRLPFSTRRADRAALWSLAEELTGTRLPAA